MALDHPDHTKLDLDVDRILLQQVFDDPDKRHVILLLYELRSELFQDLKNPARLNAYVKIMELETIYVSSFKTFADDEALVDIFFELGLIKNLRSRREFDRKDDDFIVKVVEGIRIDEDVIIVPVDALLAILRKNFSGWTKAQLNKTLKELQGIMCQTYPVIHPFVVAADEDYYMPDDLYYLLDLYANPYQCLRVEITIEGVHDRIRDHLDQLQKQVKVFDPLLTKARTKKVLAQGLNQAEEPPEDLVEYLVEELPKVSKKFHPDSELEKFEEWKQSLNALLHGIHETEDLLAKVEQIKAIYAGKTRDMTYFEFIRKVSFNEEDLLTRIEDDLVACRRQMIAIRKKLKPLTPKKTKLLNLDYERELLIEEDEY